MGISNNNTVSILKGFLGLAAKFKLKLRSSNYILGNSKTFEILKS